MQLLSFAIIPEQSNATMKRTSQQQCFDVELLHALHLLALPFLLPHLPLLLTF